MSFLTEIAGSVIGAGLGMIGANQANSAQQSFLDQQMNFNREVMQNRHQWEVQDLRQAGLNPLMSVTSPTGTLSAPSASSHQADLASSARALGELSIADKNAEANLMNARASAKNADTAYQSMLNIGSDISSQIDTRRQQLDQAERMLQSNIESAKSQQELNRVNTVKVELENEWLPKIQKANLNQIETSIANSIAETAAKIILMDRQGRASLTSAQAAIMLANTAEANGVSLRALQNKQSLVAVGEALKLGKESQILGYKRDLSKYEHDQFFNSGDEGQLLKSSKFFGDVFSNLIGVAPLINAFK